MSVILKGLATYQTSLVGGFSDITLGNPVPVVDTIDFNNEVINGDAGYNFAFNKGQSRRSFDYKFTLQSDTTKQAIWAWLMALGGDLNWFTLQPQFQSVITEVTCQAYSSYTVLKTNLGNPSDYWNGYWVIFHAGPLGTALVKRKIVDFVTGNPSYITVSPAMPAYSTVNDKFYLGYPVRLNMQKVQFAQRMPTFWDFVLSMIEEPVD